MGCAGGAAELGIAAGAGLCGGLSRSPAPGETSTLGGCGSLNRLDRRVRRTLSANKNPLRAAWNLGRDLVGYAVFALAGNPPQLSVIITAAALGWLLDLLPTRPGWMLRLE